MKKFISTILGFLVLCSIAAIATAGPDGDTSRGIAKAEKTPSVPAMSIPQPHQDFGEVPEGRVITHDFQVKNAGPVPLTIQRVRPG